MTTTPVVSLDLSGRTAMVTGAASGIGRACADRLTTAGATVIGVDLNDAATVTADLSDPDTVDTLETHIDILINNAGLQHVAPLTDFPPDRFTYLQKVMVEAPFRLIRHVLPHMYTQGWGRIINISSVHGLIASPYKAAYVTAKHALQGLSKTVALEAATHGVTANCINPAFVRTPLVDRQITDQATAHGIDESEVIEKIMLDRAAIKRLIEPAEVAELAAYLCTPMADLITGASITIDGGWTAH